MSLKKSIPAFLFLFGFTLHQGMAQLGLGADDEDDYKKEWVGGINLNTNGGLIGGVMLKHTRHIKGKMYHVFQVEIVNVKHPKEQRVVSQLGATTFIKGKHNYLWVVRPHYGREFILFKKAREQGVQVIFSGTGGLALGLVAPYLVKYDETRVDSRGKNVPTGRVLTGQLNKTIGAEEVRQPANFLSALGEANVEVGVSVKASLNFEFGITKSSVSGFEAGFNLDLFPNEIKIMDVATAANSRPLKERAVFPSVFLTFFFGSRK